MCKKQKMYIHKQDKYQQTDYVLNGVQTLDSVDKDFKSDIINMFNLLKKTRSKELKKNMTMMSYQTETLH